MRLHLPENGVDTVCYKFKLNLCYTTADDVVNNLRDDPSLLTKMHTLLSENDPDVLGYAAQLGNEMVVREFLKDSPNEVHVQCCSNICIHIPRTSSF